MDDITNDDDISDDDSNTIMVGNEYFRSCFKFWIMIVLWLRYKLRHHVKTILLLSLQLKNVLFNLPYLVTQLFLWCVLEDLLPPIRLIPSGDDSKIHV